MAQLCFQEKVTPVKFVLNSKFSESAAGMVCIKGLYNRLIENGFDAMLNDWDNYDRYDVVIFMAYDPQIDRARMQNPDIKIGLADPKPGSKSDVKKADFIMVSSLEQRELFLKHNANCFIYYMIPDFDSFDYVHRPKERIVIGYHGNKVHLNSFYKQVTPALNLLGTQYDIELHAIYNVEKLGKWTLGRPDEKKCRVVDLQWYENCYQDYFKNIDIGIVPNLYPMEHEGLIKKFFSTSPYFFLETEDDHLIKYKFSSNAGRTFVFGAFGIPVVTEAVPSAGDVIQDGYSGSLVLYAHGWYYALEKLIRSVELRKTYGSNLKIRIEDYFSQEMTFQRFISYLENLAPPKGEKLVFKASKPLFWKEMGADKIQKIRMKIKRTMN